MVSFAVYLPGGSPLGSACTVTVEARDPRSAPKATPCARDTFNQEAEVDARQARDPVPPLEITREAGVFWTGGTVTRVIWPVETLRAGLPMTWLRVRLVFVGSVWEGLGVAKSMASQLWSTEQEFQLAKLKAGSDRLGRDTSCGLQSGWPSTTGEFAMQPKTSSWYG